MKMMVHWTFSASLVVVLLACLHSAVIAAPGENLGSGCDGPSRCIRASECRRTFNKQKREREPVLFNCGFEGLNLLVCCPPEQPALSPGEDSHGHTLVPTGPVRTPASVGTIGTSTQAPFVQHNTQAPYSTQKPTQQTTSATIIKATQAPYRPVVQSAQNNNRNTQKPSVTTQKSTVTDRNSQRVTESYNTQRTTSSTTYRPIASHSSTPKYNQYQSSTVRTTSTTKNNYQTSNFRPTEHSHFITQGSPERIKPPYTEPEVPIRNSKPQVVEEEVKPLHQSGLNNQRPATDTLIPNKQPTLRPSTDLYVSNNKQTANRPQTHVTEKESISGNSRPTNTYSPVKPSVIQPDAYIPDKEPISGRPSTDIYNPDKQSNTRPLVYVPEKEPISSNARPLTSYFTPEKPVRQPDPYIPEKQPDRYEESSYTADILNQRPKRPASPKPATDFVFEEPNYTSRPTSRPVLPSYELTTRLQAESPVTEPSYIPSRRPFEPPYLGPEGPHMSGYRPSEGSITYKETNNHNHQNSRPTSRPPNPSSTYNTVGSGQSGPLWPPSQHNRPQRPLSRPSNNSQDLTEHPNFRLFPREICGTTAEGADRIINGVNATLGQFPWMALLGYKTSDAAEDFVSICGGTLISWKYVLTAAHCLKNSVRMVRLGEHVISTQPDCDQDGLCADPIQDIEIEAKIPHPSYGKPYLKNDIGLIRLRHAQPKLFSSYVRPICLPLIKDKEKHGRRLIVAGWGTTRRGSKISSDVLQMAVLPEVGLFECNDAQEDDILKPVIASQMCAAVSDNSASSCYGDSGGPLMDIQQGTGRQSDGPVIVQLGIVSVGSDDCGLQGAPSIYTRVSYFTKWILDTMKD